MIKDLTGFFDYILTLFSGQSIPGSVGKHPTSNFDALLATASEEHKSLQEEQQKLQSQPMHERLFQSFDTTDKQSAVLKQQAESRRACSPKRMRLESISPPASPSSTSRSSKSKNSSRNRSRSSSQSSTSSSRSRSSSRSSRSSSTSSNDSDDESRKEMQQNHFKNKTLPTHPQLPLKSVTTVVAPKPVATVSHNVPKYTMHLQNTGNNQSMQNALVYNSHLVAQKNAVFIGQNSNSALIVQKTSSGSKEQKGTPSIQPAYRMISPVVTSVSSGGSSSLQKNVTVINNASLSGSGVKLITGIGQTIGNSQGTQLPVQMTLLQQGSNGMTQGYQIVTLTPQSSASSYRTSQQKGIISSKPSILKSDSSGNGSHSSLLIDSKRQQQSQSKQTSASNVPKYSTVSCTSSNSLLMGSIVGSTHSKLSDIPKPKAAVHALSATSNLPLVFNHGLPSHLLPVAAFQPQSSSQPNTSSQQKSLSRKLPSPTKSTCLNSPPPIHPQPTHTPIPRIYTPSPGANASNILNELSHERHSQIQAQSLLIPSNLGQLSGGGVFNLTGQFSHQPFNGDHASLASLTGVRPNESGDAHHAIRVQGYQGLATQRLTMYSDQAAAGLRTDFPVYRPAGGDNHCNDIFI